MADKRDSFVFYRSFRETLKKIPDEKQRLQLFEAITDYALDQAETKLEGYPEVVFPLIRPQLDANIRKYENGKKGGRPKKE